MLQRLFIHNFALIEKADIHFENGFSVITGETGAGKSILLGAIGLILGDRADFSSLKNKDKKCVIEGEFNVVNYNLESFFTENDIDFEKTTILRREISNSGKSRAFINDTPVKLNILKEFGESLISIHSQNQSYQLSDENFITNLLDVYSESPENLVRYKEQLIKYKALNKELERTIKEVQQLKSDEDYIKFQYEEMKALNLSKVDFESLKNDVELSEHQEKITGVLQNSCAIFENESAGVLNQLNQIKAQLSQISSINPDFAVLFERLNSSKIELEDLKSSIEDHLEKSLQSSSSPSKIALFDEIQRIMQKHFINEFEALLKFEEELVSKIKLSSQSSTKIEELKSAISASLVEMNALSTLISKDRKKNANYLETEISKLLTELVLPNARIQFKLSNSEEFRATGKDKITLLFNANLGGELKEISKSASGGETSRLMLAVQYLLSKKKALSTLIFDEIDTGISGEIASKIGTLLNKIASNLQVVSITHLPQVASKGTSHFKVYKEDIDQETKTYIEKLTDAQRITEIAKMLSGETINEASIENAKSLLTIQ